MGTQNLCKASKFACCNISGLSLAWFCAYIITLSLAEALVRDTVYYKLVVENLPTANQRVDFPNCEAAYFKGLHLISCSRHQLLYR